MDYLYPALSVAQTAFTIWMLVDAYRRPADGFWLWVILIFQPIGPWAYFFAVKMRDQHGDRQWSLAGFFQRRPSLDELRYQADHVPTLTHQLTLAERLVEAGEHQEAMPYLEQALAREPDHCQVLYLLADCQVELGAPEKAISNLERVIERDRCWSDYAAWRLMVTARDTLHDSAGALSNCRELVRLSPTLRHRCLLAEHLGAEGHLDEACDLLSRALEDHRYAPSAVRSRNGSWASQAKRLLKQLESGRVEGRS